MGQADVTSLRLRAACGGRVIPPHAGFVLADQAAVHLAPASYTAYRSVKGRMQVARFGVLHIAQKFTDSVGRRLVPARLS